MRSRAPDQGTWSQGDGICGEDKEWTRVIETGKGIRSRELTEERVTESKASSAAHFCSNLVRGSLMRFFAGVPWGFMVGDLQIKESGGIILSGSWLQGH